MMSVSVGSDSDAGRQASLLEPDKQLIGQFIATILRHASPIGHLSLRAFYDDGGTELFKPLLTVDLRAQNFHKHAVDVAQDIARRAAQHPRKAVVCPPMAAFRDKNSAKEADIVQAFALSVDCDKHPNAGWAQLEEILGSPTVVVRSGGVWTNGNGPEPKVHLYWRLTVPATSAEQLARLKEARRLATTIAGGDVSNVPNCHCLRLPGSWHRKAEPRLCDIAVLNDDAEIDLDAALQRLRAVAPQEKLRTDNGTGSGDGVDWGEKLLGIVTTENYHEAVVSLSASMAASGIPEDQCLKLIHSRAMRSSRRTMSVYG
jgi:hypothetical protein